MLDNDNIMTAKASEVVKKAPTNEKDYYKSSLCVIVSKKGAITGSWWVLV